MTFVVDNYYITKKIVNLNKMLSLESSRVETYESDLFLLYWCWWAVVLEINESFVDF